MGKYNGTSSLRVTGASCVVPGEGEGGGGRGKGEGEARFLQSRPPLDQFGTGRGSLARGGLTRHAHPGHLSLRRVLS